MSEGYKILIVDDDAFAAEFTAIMLESEGYEVVSAEGGIDALDKIEQDPLIKIVISDMNMPIMNGVELFEELQKLGIKKPFVLLTGSDSVSLKNKNPAIDAVITKDENYQEILLRLIKDILQKS